MNHPVTPDGRYFVVKERLWRCTNPDLPEDERARLVSELMSARRAVRTALRAEDAGMLRAARARVHAAKVALGERGPTWWGDERDYNRCMIRNTPYAGWWTSEQVATD